MGGLGFVGRGLEGPGGWGFVGTSDIFGGVGSEGIAIA